MPYILALDQGTTSSRSLIFNDESRVVATGQREFSQIYPRSGWVEHDPEEIWQTQLETVLAALEKSGVLGSDLAAVGLTNQRETTIVWDRETGLPIYNAIVWQDRRTSRFCNEIR